MSWLADLPTKIIQIAGSVLPQRQILNFVSGATVVDNPSNGSTDVTITGGGGGVVGTLQYKTANYQTLNSDGTIVLASLSAPVTITLVDATTVADRFEQTITDGSGEAGTYAITVKGSGSQLVNGANTQQLNTNYISITVQKLTISATAQWVIIGGW